jgi:hypothetical protein
MNADVTFSETDTALAQIPTYATPPSVTIRATGEGYMPEA